MKKILFIATLFLTFSYANSQTIWMSETKLKGTIGKYEIVITRVIIHKLVDGVFYSSIICEKDALEEVIDARTSDAIALALRFNAPIFTYKNILDKAGIFLNKNKKELHSDEEIDDDNILSEPEVFGKEVPQNIYSKFTIQELHNLLEEAIQNEDYEKAALIKEEIDRK